MWRVEACDNQGCIVTLGKAGSGFAAMSKAHFRRSTAERSLAGILHSDMFRMRFAVIHACDPQGNWVIPMSLRPFQDSCEALSW